MNLVRTLSLNLIFALNVLYGHSIISLIPLFTIFVLTLGLLMHSFYMAVNDSTSQLNQEFDFEEVSPQWVVQLLSFSYSKFYTLYNQYISLVAFLDPEHSLVALAIFHLLVLWTFLCNVSVMALVWAIHLACILRPFYYPKIQPYASRLC